MGNTMIYVILLVVALIGLYTLRKNLRGQRGCCGSAGDYKARKKKLHHVIAVKTFRVEGMHCEKCSNRVMEVINDIDHVAAEVDLKKGIATVSYEQEVADDLIRSRIERVGYTVTEIC